MDKIRRFKAAAYAQDYMLMATVLWHWRKLRPDNDELKAMAAALSDTHVYVQSLEADLRVLQDLQDAEEIDKVNPKN